MARGKKKQLTTAEWSTLIAKQAGSGLRMNQWCAENGIKSRTMSEAKRRMTAKSIGGWAAVTVGAGNTTSQIVEARDSASLRVGDAFTIRCGRIEVDLPGGCGSESFAMIVKGLVNLC